MKQWIVNIILFILVLVALGFSLLKVTPFEITSETYIGVIVSLLRPGCRICNRLSDLQCHRIQKRNQRTKRKIQ